MEKRILLKEIPHDKFHSAIFTTYSINLYYLEQQVLPLLGGKGIHYVSILADSKMLSEQLASYGSLSDQRKRSYSIHGIQCNGAFHPKIILLAGYDCLMLLLGSGNLTSSGHGKNLEVWNAIYVNNADDPKLGLLIQAWSYLKEIHFDLGESAQSKIKSIEENCNLLNNLDLPIISAGYAIDENTSLSFLSASKEKSLYRQLIENIDNQIIRSITIMSPFYDLEGKFIHQLNQDFKPKKINIILQEDFGANPTKMEIERNMQIFDWIYVQEENIKQKYFHAKNIVFEGRNKSFLLSGSANASIAAFGTKDLNMINQEACILYQSTNANFLELLGLDLKGGKNEIEAYMTDSIEKPDKDLKVKQLVFIKSVERNYDSLTIYFSTKKKIQNVTLRLFDSKGKEQVEKTIDLKKGDSILQIAVPKEINLFYCEISKESESISNKQFVIDTYAFENTNPSPRNRSLNQIRKLIESGDFLTPKIIDYLNTIYKQKDIRRLSSTSTTNSEKSTKDDWMVEDENDLLYLSYEEIQEKTKLLDQSKKSIGYIEYKSVRLWESFYIYLKESKEKEDESKIDEEETEDINKSSGRETKDKEKNKSAISKSNHEKLKTKVEKFLLKYYAVLRSKIADKNKAEQPNLIDLSMFLVMLEILLHLLSHKEIIKDEGKEEHLLLIPFSNKVMSWSQYILDFIGMFSLWCNQKGGFKIAENEEYGIKLNDFKKMAFQTSVNALSLFSMLNQNYNKDKIKMWKNLGLFNVFQCFNSDLTDLLNIDDFTVFVPQKTKEEIGEAIYLDELNVNLTILKNFKSNLENSGYYKHTVDGYSYIAKTIQNPQNKDLVFYKLYNIGYEWEENVLNYWNEKLYSLYERKWLKTKREESM